MSAAGPALGTKKTVKQQKLYTLWVHTEKDQQELIVNPHFFPHVSEGDIFEIYKPSNREKRLYLFVGALVTIRASLQLSIIDDVARAFDFSKIEEVVVNVVAKDSAAVDLVELSFKDQYISRADMWRINLALVNESVYVKKEVIFSNMRGVVKELVADGVIVHAGIITEKTKLVFRSKSAEFIIYFQMSKEMWEFDDDGQLYFEKAVNGFLPQLFEKWQTAGANHSLTLILFSRTLYTPEQVLRMTGDMKKAVQTDCIGRPFHDFYVVLCSNERTDLESLLIKLKKKFIEYPRLVNWSGGSTAVAGPSADASNQILGENSSADWCNFLEAINLAQNHFDQRQYVDRDLTRTNQSVVVVSAGTGVYHVDAGLAQDTKHRMTDKGIGCDLVCLAKAPLHIVPLLVLHHAHASPAHSPLDFSLPHSLSQASISTSTLSTSSTARGATGSSYSHTRGHTRSESESQTFTPATTPPGSLTKQMMAEAEALANLPAERRVTYKSAHWMYLFFFEQSGASNISSVSLVGSNVPHGPTASSISSAVEKDDTPTSHRSFLPTCRLPELQYRTVVPKSEVIIPYRITWKPPPPAYQIPGPGIHHQHHHSVPSPSHHSSSSLPRWHSATNLRSYDRQGHASPSSSPPEPSSSLTHSESATLGYNTAVPGYLRQLQSTQDLNASRDQHDADLFHAAPSNFSGPTHKHLRSLTGDAALPGHRHHRPDSHVLGSLNPSTISNLSASLTKRASNTSPMGSSAPRTKLAPPTSTAGTSPTDAGSHTSHFLARSQRSTQGSLTVQSPDRAKGQSAPAKLNLHFSSPTLNPFNYDSQEIVGVNKRRWAHIFADVTEVPDMDLHWTSLTQPASLPLTTDYFPTSTELSAPSLSTPSTAHTLPTSLQQYDEYYHNLAIIPEDNPYEKANDLFRELVGQRLLQGYQLIIIDSTPPSPSATIAAPVPQISVPVGNATPGDAPVASPAPEPRPATPSPATDAPPKAIDNPKAVVASPSTAPGPAKASAVAGAKKSAPSPSKNTASLASVGNSRSTNTFQRAGSKKGPTPARPATVAAQPSAQAKIQIRRKYILAAGHSFHKMDWAGETSEQSVEVKRYHKKKALMIHAKPFTYTYFLWGTKTNAGASVLNSSVTLGQPSSGSGSGGSSPVLGNSASGSFGSPSSLNSSVTVAMDNSQTFSCTVLRHTQISYQPMSTFKWSQLDHLIGGSSADINDATNQFWRIGLMLVASDGHTARANAIAGFEKLKDFLKLRIATRVAEPEYRKIEVDIVSELPTLSPQEKLDPTHLKTIVLSLKKTIAGERKFKNKTYQFAFLGSEAVDWIAEHVRVKSRQAAAEVCQQLLRLQMIINISLTQDTFVDGPHYYTLSTNMAAAPTPQSSPGPSSRPSPLASPSKVIPSDSAKMMSMSLDPRAGVELPFAPSAEQRHATLESPPDRSAAGILSFGKEKKRTITQRTVRIEMDTQKTDRYEWLNMKYDTVFDPDVVYELEFQWLVGTGSIIAEFLNLCIRRAKSVGLSLIPIPVDHTASGHPFQLPQRKSCQMLRFSQQARQSVLKALVERLDFVHRKYPEQFIHRSGALLVDVVEDSFEWTINTADWASQSSAATMEVLRRFLDFCAEMDLPSASSTTDPTTATPIITTAPSETPAVARVDTPAPPPATSEDMADRFESIPLSQTVELPLRRLESTPTRDESPVPATAADSVCATRGGPENPSPGPAFAREAPTPAPTAGEAPLTD